MPGQPYLGKRQVAYSGQPFPRIDTTTFACAVTRPLRRPADGDGDGGGGGGGGDGDSII
ncbi:hypothetical protein ANO14919_016070 [Xylariales sp. No.14919]|nr:hypothetical protein ANO14919_016070 [Xylariales sp. No.14919]